MQSLVTFRTEFRFSVSHKVAKIGKQSSDRMQHLCPPPPPYRWRKLQRAAKCAESVNTRAGLPSIWPRSEQTFAERWTRKAPRLGSLFHGSADFVRGDEMLAWIRFHVSSLGWGLIFRRRKCFPQELLRFKQSFWSWMKRTVFVKWTLSHVKSIVT